MTDALTALLILVAGGILLIWLLPLWGHEAGHYLAAKAVGAGYDYIPLGPFVLARDGHRRTLQLRLRRFPCDSVLPARSPSTAAQLLAATLAGPLLIMTLGLFGLALVAMDANVGSNIWSPLILVLSSLFLAVSGLRDLIPWRPYGTPSDGRRVLSLVRETWPGRRWMALRRITRQSEDGVRPRDWDQADVELIGEMTDGSLDDVSGGLTLYWHHLDAGRDEEADRHLKRAGVSASARYLPGVNSRLVLLEEAYRQARAGTDPQQALASFAGSSAVARATLSRVSSAILMLYADFAGAEEAAEGGLTHLASLRPGFAALELDLLVALREEARRRQAYE